MREVTLLWGLRSPCNLGCRYCYFGTVEEHRTLPPAAAGALSHLSRSDLPLEQILAFTATLKDSPVQRVFLAGGEPLIWPPILDVIAAVKNTGVQVVVCTNGIPLNRPDLVAGLLERGVDAVSVSLDSADPVYNDTWRPARNGRDGWRQVIDGVTALLAARAACGAAGPKVGLYSVITRRNLPDITAVPALAAELGCDYAVPQPIALSGDHALHGELSLNGAHAAELTERFTALYGARLPLRLPPASYPGRVAAAVRQPTGRVKRCFGGTTLFFVEPDGSVWDCPSSLKITATPAERRRSIVDATATDLFTPTGCAADCGLFSVDCVNMWPLMGFDRLLTPTGAA
ncbi:radical SAM protein [Planomonospora sp. ID91781]|uniref:radical SAM protein n=1 Tax=Planomonospora sp. ID91781 TaxID=2738135 RepID=UPI0018C3760E|nr:radical SAM protein [Planomonospora sp. ID91781]MBG0825713.1 radical SAM protein [Planomonospora sp. ID91781]